jgi:hypothetical protein
MWYFSKYSLGIYAVLSVTMATLLIKLPPKMNEFLQKTSRLNFSAGVLRSSRILVLIYQNRI